MSNKEGMLSWPPNPKRRVKTKIYNEKQIGDVGYIDVAFEDNKELNRDKGIEI